MRKKWVAEKKRVVGTRPPLPEGVVKSAGRVLQILEYFDEIQRPANVHFTDPGSAALAEQVATAVERALAERKPGKGR